MEATGCSSEERLTWGGVARADLTDAAEAARVGTQTQCSMPVSAARPSSGVVGSCPTGAACSLELSPVDSCPPVVCDGAACEGTTCTPIAGRFQMTVTLQGLPSQVGLGLSFNGMTLTSETVASTSATTEPDGQGCGTCTNASATVSIPTG